MLAGGWLMAVVLLGQGCNDAPAPAPPAPDPPPADPFSDSDCAACVTVVCSQEVDACAAEPECGPYLSCVFDCPTSEMGDVDAACESACDLGKGSVYHEVREALVACRVLGAGSACSACRDVSWIVDQQCDDSSETDACARCEEERCCQTMGEAKANPEAEAFIQCMLGCFDANGDHCEEACAALHPDGVAAFVRRLACAMVRCLDECEATWPCQVCTGDRCAIEYVALVGDPVGYLLNGCIAACDDSSCAEACMATHPTAVPMLDALVACTEAKCPDVCS